MMRGRYGACVAVAVAAVMVLMATLALGVQAAGLKPILSGLQRGDVFVAPQEFSARRAQQAEVPALRSQAAAAAAKGFAEKFAILSSAPGSAANGAHLLRSYLNYGGTVILVDPHGIGISSGTLSASDDARVAQSVAAQCVTGTETGCALAAGQQALAIYTRNQSTTQHNAAMFWAVVLVILALVIGTVILLAMRRRRATTERLTELQGAASSTLSLADTAVQEIEGVAGVRQLTSAQRSEYDQALALRDRARVELDRATTSAALTQANQDAAQAVLALQGVQKALGIASAAPNPLETSAAPRCFYCGRDDRPPYYRQSISDSRGNSMEIDVCSVDHDRLAQGRTPAVATQQYQGMAVPWWAVPSNPYYYAYGGPTWQYWLPFVIGMDVGGWYGGGWENPMLYGAGQDWDDGSQFAGDQGAAAGPNDAGGVDYGNWDSGGAGNDSGGWDSGGSAGGWDSGGDSGGGWDSGGDSGGWDSGGDSGSW